MSDSHLELSEDIICGATAIGRFITPAEGARKLSDKQLARKVFHLVATSRLPCFRLGSRICARRTILLAWIATQEARCAGECGRPCPPLKHAAGQSR
jgi:hypothetical protein